MALPLDASPVQALRADPRLWSEAEAHPPFSRPWPAEDLPEVSQVLLAVLSPDTRWIRDHFAGRNHGQAEYLLDPAAFRHVRSWAQREQTPTYRAIFGAGAFAAHASSGQGIPWRCSTPAQLADAVRLIDGLDVAAVRREFSVAEMHDLGVYKTHGGEDEDETFARDLQDLRSWAECCRSVAAQGLGMIITLA
jgi:hypothetical protein